MNFDSLVFLGLLGATLVGVWSIDVCRWRVWFLLVASWAFYGSWDARFLVLILWLAVVTWIGALVLQESAYNRGLLRKAFVLVITLLLLPLAFFKYFNFLGATLFDLVRVVSPDRQWSVVDIILPVGISFFTFHAISYVADVYSGRLSAERSFARIALYLSFFPHLIAGPIVRATDFLPQLENNWARPSQAQMAAAMARFAWGMFKKVLIADRLAGSIVDPVFAQPELASAGLIALAVIAFGLMIYADFSGYSDMAIASAAMCGIRFRENFRAPYLSTSIRDFWRRWHISLSSWIRDYVYIPLGGSRQSSPFVNNLNVMIAMTLCGLWHGAAWAFVLWGAMHGCGIVVERFLKSRLPKGAWRTPVGWFFTTLFVYASWAIFRANDFSVLQTLLSGLSSGDRDIHIHDGLLVFIALSALLLYAEQAFLLWTDRQAKLGTRKAEFSWLAHHATMMGIVATAGLTIVLLLLHYPEAGARNFIYFQF